MTIKKFNLPDPGEGLLEAEIVTWKVKEGDAVKVNDIVVEIETAKSLVELPIPWAGTVAQILVPEGETVDVGTPIIAIEDGTGGGAPAEPDDASAAAAQAQVNEATGTGDDAAPKEERVAVLVGYGPKVTDAKRRPRKHQRGPLPTASETKDPETWGGLATVAAVTEMTHPTVVDPHGVQVQVAQPQAAGGKALAKPPVRKYAKDKGVDLALIRGTGNDGAITRADVDAYLAAGASGAAAQGAGAPSPQPGQAAGAAAYGTAEREVRIPIKGVRKVTAQAMVGSAFTAPHVTEFVTVDVSETMALVERLKGDKEFKDVRVSPLLVVAKALIVASRRNPGVNATWDEAAQEIVHKNYVNLGIAAATPRGLMVPNIRDADRLTMLELARAMGSLVETARAGRTQPAEMSGGTITITNVGVFGVDTGTPIINPGESAILAFGAVRRQPWVVTAADGSETIEPRWVTQLALSFDHRLIDGELGSRFLADVAKVLEDPARGLVWG